MNNQDNKQEISPWRYLLAVVVFFAFFGVFFAILMDMGKPVTIETHSNSYQTVSTMDGPMGKTTCILTTVGDTARMVCN